MNKLMTPVAMVLVFSAVSGEVFAREFTPGVRYTV